MLFRHLHEGGSKEEKDAEAHGENAKKGKDYCQNKYFKIKTFPDEIHCPPLQWKEKMSRLPRPGSRKARKSTSRRHNIILTIYYLNYRAIYFHVKEWVELP
jgi:hypothetical protein